jgi:hypothetical protein
MLEVVLHGKKPEVAETSEELEDKLNFLHVKRVKFTASPLTCKKTNNIIQAFGILTLSDSKKWTKAKVSRFKGTRFDFFHQ